MSDPPVSSKTLLVIDDDPSVLQLVRLLMGPYLAQVWVSLDPHEGLRLAMMHKPSLILLDNHMQDMLGVQVLEQLRSMPATSRIPVVMMTADNTLATVRKAADQDVQDYLLKPCDPDLLLEKLGPWLGLVQERPSRELNAKLQLTPEQEHVLDMRCLLNVLGRLAHELNLLTLGAKDAVVLKAALTKLQGFRHALGQPPPRLDLFGQFTRFEAEVFSQLAGLWQEHPELAGKLRSACEDNLHVLFEVLRERAQEFMARVSNPLGWKALSLAQVRALLAYPLEAAGSNSLAQYRPRYNELEQAPEDYLIEIVIRSRETDRIQVPLLLPDVMRELSAFAYEQTPPGGRIRMRLEEERRLLTLQVSDGGQGLNLETLKRLAEYGPDEPALLKAYSVTRQLGGHMSLCSRPGAGIDVILEIPTPSAPRA